MGINFPWIDTSFLAVCSCLLTEFTDRNKLNFSPKCLNEILKKFEKMLQNVAKYQIADIIRAGQNKDREN